MAAVQYVNASRIFEGNQIPAVSQLDLDIADGEFMVLVGPSGSGKSTALRMMAGLEDVDEGEIRIGGQDVSQKPPKDRDIAMVFQNYALYPHMTVAENMGFALKLQRVPKMNAMPKFVERPNCSIWRPTWTVSPRHSPAVNANASRWDERSSANRVFS